MGKKKNDPDIVGRLLTPVELEVVSGAGAPPGPPGTPPVDDYIQYYIQTYTQTVDGDSLSW